MKRRDALAALTALAGGTLAGSQLILSACQADDAGMAYRFFTASEISLLEQIADTILPATADSPGAADTGIGAFMDVFVADCFEPEEQKALREGLPVLDRRCRDQFGNPFQELSSDQQQEFLVALDIEAEAYQRKLRGDAPSHYFSMIKYLTILGYFTSEPGATQALRYLPVPGRYEGDIPLKAGDKAWAI